MEGNIFESLLVISYFSNLRYHFILMYVTSGRYTITKMCRCRWFLGNERLILKEPLLSIIRNSKKSISAYFWPTPPQPLQEERYAWGSQK